MARAPATAKSRRRRWSRAAVLCAWVASLWAAHAAAVGDPDPSRVAAHIAVLAAGEDAELQAFYAARDHRPAWAQASRVRALAAAVASLAEDGLDPAHYRAAELAAQWAAVQGADGDALATAAFDLRASRAWLAALRDLGRGRAPPAWVRSAAPAPDVAQLARDLEEEDLERSLARVRPAQPLYRQLRAGLARYRELARSGGWEALPAGPTLHPGDRHDPVVALRARLGRERDDPAPVPAADPSLFDPALVAAVRAFQRDHGLREDGIVGARTRAALDVPAAARVAQLRVNLERARWLLPMLPDTHVLVDIAAQELEFIAAGQLQWRTRVVVGRPSRPTPELRSEITRLKFHPAWIIPPTILRQDVLPKLRRDPGYLAREGIEVLSPTGEPLDPGAARRLAYGEFRLRQRPGARNPLGRVVIRFPNPHHVYLHDTPAQELFELEERALSSGCIRVENALELVYLLLADERRWPRAAVLAAAQAGITRSVELARPVPVILWYRTARAEADGRIGFLPDIYGRDAAVLAALERAPAG